MVAIIVETALAARQFELRSLMVSYGSGWCDFRPLVNVGVPDLKTCVSPQKFDLTSRGILIIEICCCASRLIELL